MVSGAAAEDVSGTNKLVSKLTPNSFYTGSHWNPKSLGSVYLQIEDFHQKWPEPEIEPGSSSSYPSAISMRQVEGRQNLFYYTYL